VSGGSGYHRCLFVCRPVFIEEPVTCKTCLFAISSPPSKCSSLLTVATRRVSLAANNGLLLNASYVRGKEVRAQAATRRLKIDTHAPSHTHTHTHTHTSQVKSRPCQLAGSRCGRFHQGCCGVRAVLAAMLSEVEKAEAGRTKRLGRNVRIVCHSSKIPVMEAGLAFQ